MSILTWDRVKALLERTDEVLTCRDIAEQLGYEGSVQDVYNLALLMARAGELQQYERRLGDARRVYYGKANPIHPPILRTTEGLKAVDLT